jgi:hypothetical protein
MVLCYSAPIAPLMNSSDWKVLESPKMNPTSPPNIANNQIQLNSSSSHDAYICSLPINISQTPILSFSWKISDVISSANITIKHLDDAPIRILILFKEDNDRKSWIRRQIDTFFLWAYGELPYDYSMAYVWSNQKQDNDVIEGAYTHKLRSVVLDSGNDRAGQWVTHQINLYDNFIRAYGGPPPPQEAFLGILSDTDTTHSEITAWVKNIRFKAID